MIQKFIVAFVGTFLLVSCTAKKILKADNFANLLGSETGQDHTVMKAFTQTGNYAVFKNEVTGEFVAYDLNNYDSKGTLSYQEYMSTGIVEGIHIVRNLTVTKEKVRDRDYVNGEWVTDYKWENIYSGNGYRFENSSSTSKELDTLASLEEEAMDVLITQTLKSELSLSENRASELAILAKKYKRLENARELTSSEKDQFALKALGVSMTELEEALIEKTQGDDSRFESLLQVAARANNTTPEQIGQFFSEIIE